MLKKILIILAVLIAALWLRNTSLFTSPASDGPPQFIAHRGVHQTYHREDLERDTCTANRIYPPTHDFIENTLPSMQAAFDAGADVVEIDVHLTPDGEFAVFHDWTLDCRTEAEGQTNKTPMSVLRTLDAGYGYTADNGQTFPLRGKGVGMIRSLSEVLDAFPEGRFLINFKSRRAVEGRVLAEMLEENPRWRAQVWGVYGGPIPSEALVEHIPDMLYFTKASAKDCLIDYALIGWSSHVPKSCHNTLVPVPADYAPLLWGWPRAFEARMNAAGSTVILFGTLGGTGNDGAPGIDTPSQLRKVPKGFGGYVWTDRIESLGDDN
ncbi:MAG: glycerophosphodiester phosphodiesterase [Alphaproteobacteria bacterium HGW-Alphaproteobacteria-18]|nr:MAG: glycerophosphodiester phosphodiesterase [Alphaproteobacteria bacterium HGW-Alphaproteobacteria-18]